MPLFNSKKKDESQSKSPARHSKAAGSTKASRPSRSRAEGPPAKPPSQATTASRRASRKPDPHAALQSATRDGKPVSSYEADAKLQGITPGEYASRRAARMG